MSLKSVAEKAHVKPSTTVAVINPVAGVVDSLGLPADISFADPDTAELVLLFAHTAAELEELMPPAIRALSPTSVLWVFFRKGGAAAGLDMGRNDVWAIAESFGMRPLGLLSVDDAWSVFRLKPST